MRAARDRRDQPAILPPLRADGLVAHTQGQVRARWKMECGAPVLGVRLYIGKWCRPHAPPDLTDRSNFTSITPLSQQHIFTSVSPRFHIDSPRLHIGFISVSHRFTSFFTVRLALFHRYSDVNSHFPDLRSARSLWSVWSVPPLCAIITFNFNITFP